MNRKEFIKRSSMVVSAAFLGGLTACRKNDAGDSEEAKKDLLRVKDKNNPTVLEKKHVPGIEAPSKVKKDQWFDIKVKIGYMTEHPSESGHWITIIKLLVDDAETAEMEYKTGGVASPAAVFRIKLSKTSKIEVVENCNLHGTWISDPVKIMV